MGIFDGIFGSSDTKSTTTAKTPAWITTAGQNNYQALQRVVDKPYQGFTGERVASINPTAQKAYNAAGAMVGAPNAYGSAADAIRTGTNAGASHISTPTNLANDYQARGGDPYASIDTYMNPYLQGVLDPTIRSIQESGDRARLAQDAQSTGAGAFGDARHGIEDSLLWRDEGRNIGDATNSVYSQGFTNAQAQRNQSIAQLLGLQQGDITNKMAGETTQGQFNEAAANRSIQGGAALASNQGAQTQDELSRINAAAGAGQAMQANQQQKDDFNYAQYLEARGWDQDSNNTLMGALSGTPYQRSSVTNTTPASQGISGILGSLLGAAIK